jgi:hypothetical protein
MRKFWSLLVILSCAACAAKGVRCDRHLQAINAPHHAATTFAPKDSAPATSAISEPPVPRRGP